MSIYVYLVVGTDAILKASINNVLKDWNKSHEGYYRVEYEHPNVRPSNYFPAKLKIYVTDRF